MSIYINYLIFINNFTVLLIIYQGCLSLVTDLNKMQIEDEVILVFYCLHI